MSSMAAPMFARRMPIWMSTVASLGILWNIFGVLKWLQSIRMTAADWIASGLSESQAATYLALPNWVTLVFAVGVFAGLIGSIALLLQHRFARPVLNASLLAYMVLFAADVYYGIFAAIPSQLPILIAVVLIALGLAIAARWATPRSNAR